MTENNTKVLNNIISDYKLSGNLTRDVCGLVLLCKQYNLLINKVAFQAIFDKISKDIDVSKHLWITYNAVIVSLVDYFNRKIDIHKIRKISNIKRLQLATEKDSSTSNILSNVSNITDDNTDYVKEVLETEIDYDFVAKFNNDIK